MATATTRDSFVERMGGALTSAGLARLPSRVFAALLVDDDGRMTAAEIASGLGVSPAGVSGAVRYLDGIGMIRRERERGSRRDVFVVEDDAWHGMIARVDQVYAPLIAALDRGLADLPPADPAHHRLRLAREFLAFVLTEMSDLDRRWAARRAELGLDD
ncbi:GbsR/MarR family transcriptional regulator [Nocardioides daeguensis]|uniref:MarR family transcriptional regulator n=1 Tax=Nocardioides daeguensis TaxID=908359 RepID=A0ABP6W1U1_9ACTN|nr:MarR family transcriptional regulator [Nocardioides daeguensis]MBV6726695.1 MarR family transcriptional regulator [Nocardioides daeguensis]MCR1774553.1 MarR family transcriptional regulator [Nocardioides daeguensis]